MAHDENAGALAAERAMKATSSGRGDSAVVTPRMNHFTKQAVDAALKGYDFVIDHTWDGQPVAHEPFTIHLQWHFERVPGKPHKRVIRCIIEGPLFDDPEPPDDLP
uniref:Uncharacterized protein n=1 Tax=Plectus sambesii TaxID=2011161 RepID=A0A914XS33_9BILA